MAEKSAVAIFMLGGIGMTAKEYKETAKKQDELAKLKDSLLTKIRTYLNELKLK